MDATHKTPQALAEEHRPRRWIIDAVIVAALLVAAIIFYPWDDPVSDAMQRFFDSHLEPAIPRYVIQPFRLLGKTDMVFFLIIFISWATSNRRLLWRFTVAASTSGLFVLFVKYVVGRQRPDADNYLSFPSGDSATAFTWAVLLAAEYPVLALPSYAIAAMIAVLRVAHGRHHPSDILVGAAIGFIASRIASRYIRIIPGWFSRMLRKIRWHVTAVVAFASYVLLRAMFEKTFFRRPWALILAAVVVAIVVLATRLRQKEDGMMR